MVTYIALNDAEVAVLIKTLCEVKDVLEHQDRMFRISSIPAQYSGETKKPPNIYKATLIKNAVRRLYYK